VHAYLIARDLRRGEVRYTLSTSGQAHELGAGLEKPGRIVVCRSLCGVTSVPRAPSRATARSESSALRAEEARLRVALTEARTELTVIERVIPRKRSPAGLSGGGPWSTIAPSPTVSSAMGPQTMGGGAVRASPPPLPSGPRSRACRSAGIGILNALYRQEAQYCRARELSNTAEGSQVRHDCPPRGLS
jgi:hypothetical protein